MIRRFLSVCVASTVVALATASTAVAATTATVIRITDTSNWQSPSPDPTGVAYRRSRDRLVVVDSEVEETSLYHDANVWFTTRKGRARDFWPTVGFSKEPTDIAVKGRRTFFFTDDDLDRVFRVVPGPDADWGTQDDIFRSFSTRPFGSRDPEGLAFGHVGKRNFLYIADGKDAQIYRLAPGENGRFDGVPPVGDDVVKSSFDTASLGMPNPKGVCFDADARLVYIVAHTKQVIVRTTPKGVAVDSIDISSSEISHPSGIALAPGTDDPSAMHVYVTDKGVDNNQVASENDGRLFEFALSS